MLTEKYDFRITDQMTIPLRPHWIANDSYREKCKMLVLNRSKGEIHKVDFSKLTDYIKEGDVICFNDSTIINHMFICKTRQNRLIKIVLEGFLPNNRVIGGLISFITLHVASTEMLSNRKIQTKCVEEVTINEEYYEVPQATADIINTAKQNGGRIFAVGTTVTRCLESAYSREHNCLKASSGWTALYIHPGYQLKVVDCLLTNLHQPKTTHMVLTGQFAGVDLLIKAYTSEHIQSCQFDMFGDCMLIIQDEGQG
ncbi:S-adenosylmethionine:tRNA ribosyltransferase-isomerase [Salmonella enterica subsp. enterica]|nr:S-adenosylmethionine:tRNA ribosyltransferase-isomerase [Salmonella enterica subsp. enterica serovar Typhimurium]